MSARGKKATTEEGNGKSPIRSAPFEYVFPAIRGTQANREFYISMCPLRLLPRVFLFNEEELVPELRAQRVLNKTRLPEMTRYILDNPDSYVFSAITASIDGEIRFEPMGSNSHSERIGALHVDMGAQFIINDGQHRRAAIENALRERPELADETIAVVFYLDSKLERTQQMFADLNRHAVRPSKSVGVLYDHRDPRALIARSVVLKSKVFREVVETERSTLSLRSRKLFTLSAIYGATNALLKQIEPVDVVEQSRLAIRFWEAVGTNIPEWEAVKARKLAASEVRSDYLHSHGIALQALGRVGNCLLRKSKDPKSWDKYLRKLRSIDWGRSNAALWEGRAMLAGRVSKAEQSVVLTTNAIKMHLRLSLSPEEERTELAYKGGRT